MKRLAVIVVSLLGGAVVAWLAVSAPGAAQTAADQQTKPAPTETVERVVPRGRDQITLSFAPLVEKAAPAVVNIFTRKRVREGTVSPLLEEPIIKRLFGRALPQFGEREKFESSLGSGVIVAPDGVIVTNHHVIQGASDIVVALADKRHFPALVIVDDPRTDLAILRIPTSGYALPYLEFADSNELKVGDLVVAIGNPFGVGQTVTTGIISALARTAVGITDYRFFIQTDAAINPGNSGGALIDVDGKIVGINTAIYSRGGPGGGSVGIGFAVPSVMVRSVVEAAVSGQDLVRPWLGISGQTVDPRMAAMLGLPRPIGVLVSGLHPESPLAEAGLAAGDLILALDGGEIEDYQALRFRIATRKVGESVSLTIGRQGLLGMVSVELVAPPDKPEPNEKTLRGFHPLAGARVASLSPKLAEELGLDSGVEGIAILSVSRGSRANDNGFHGGDIVRLVNGEEVKVVADLEPFFKRRYPGWKVMIRRGEVDITADIR